MSCAEQLRTQAFLDGELDAAACADAERHIETCAACQAFVAGAALTGDLIRRHAQRHTAPPKLRRKIRTALTPISAPWRSGDGRRGLALGAGGTALLAAALALFVLLPPSASSLTEALVNAHTAALMNGQTIQVVSSSHHTVKPWFAGKLAISPPVGDFHADGFDLAGGRIAHVAGLDMAVLVYHHGAHEIDLFSWADRGTALPEPILRHGYRTLFWKSADLDFAAVSDMENAEFEKFQHLVLSVPE